MSHLLNATRFEVVSLWVVLGIAVLGLLYALLAVPEYKHGARSLEKV